VPLQSDNMEQLNHTELREWCYEQFKQPLKDKYDFRTVGPILENYANKLAGDINKHATLEGELKISDGIVNEWHEDAVERYEMGLATHTKPSNNITWDDLQEAVRYTEERMPPSEDEF